MLDKAEELHGRQALNVEGRMKNVEGRMENIVRD